LQTAERVGKTVNGLSACRLTIIRRYATDAKDEYKTGGMVPNLLSKCLGSSALLVYLFLLIVSYFVKTQRSRRPADPLV
jgi:hypothetical protein